MRIRITFSKSGSLRYTGHLDLHTIWERTARRAGLPLAYTQGFHPGPRIQLASALPLGFIGQAEIVDLWLNEEREGSNDFSRYYSDKLQPSAPPGLTVLSVEPVDERAPALQTVVTSAEYLVTLLDPPPPTREELASRIQTLLASSTLPRERRGKPYDLRPLIEELSLGEDDSSSPSSVENGQGWGRALHMRLAARSGATGRPEEVLDALGIPFESTRITRTRIIL